MAINPSTSALHIVLASNESRHISSLFHLIKSISDLGYRVSFVSTPSGIKSIPIDPSIPIPSNLDLVPLQGDTITNFKKEFIKFLLETTRDVDSVLFDYSTYWVPEIIKKLGIQSAYIIFDNVIASTFLWPALCKPDFAELQKLMKEEYRSGTEYSNEASTLLNQLFSCDAENYLPLYSKINKAITTCDMVALANYYELDEMLPQNLERICQKEVVSFGHLQSTATNAMDNQMMNSNSIKEWLNERDMCSVVYVAFEVEVCLTPQQVFAIAYGLEKSRSPFIWVTRNSQGKHLELPGGFEERTISYGLVWKHWVPYADILGHPSIGGFLTNGSWSLCVEALNFGIPLIITPLTTAEVHNAHLIENKRLGWEVKKGPRHGVFLSSKVDQAVAIVMRDQSGAKIRECANGMTGVLRSRQYSYLTNFLCHLAEMKKMKKMKNVVDITDDAYVCSFNGCVICKDKKKNIVGTGNNVN